MDDERRCPHCASGGAVSRGKARGLRRYRRKACGKTFGALTGTALSGTSPQGALAGLRRIAGATRSPAAAARADPTPATGPSPPCPAVSSRRSAADRSPSTCPLGRPPSRPIVIPTSRPRTTPVSNVSSTGARRSGSAPITPRPSSIGSGGAARTSRPSCARSPAISKIRSPSPSSVGPRPRRRVLGVPQRHHQDRPPPLQRRTPILQRSGDPAANDEWRDYHHATLRRDRAGAGRFPDGLSPPRARRRRRPRREAPGWIPRGRPRPR